jgi:hypothetical protein
MKGQTRRIPPLRLLHAAFTLSCAVMLASVVQAQVLVPQLTTNKGCQETGDDPVFAVGEQVAVNFRVGSASASQAAMSIIDHTTGGQVAVFAFGQLQTNVTFTFRARVAGPSGTETLVLRAKTQTVTTDSGPCSFTVGPAPPTGSPAATRTPTATRTPQPATRTPTPGGGDLTGDLHTSRGCREDGDAATFAVGERITISLRLDSDTSSTARASLLNTRPNGLQTLISFGTLPTNVPLLIDGQVGPPAGVHTLRLRGAISGSQTTLDTCSFLVSGSAFPTFTPKPTRTTTPTRTMTPLPGPCVGACTQPNAVSVTDLLTVIKIAAGEAPLSDCPSADPNDDQQVSLEEVLQAVNNALDGCPGT